MHWKIYMLMHPVLQFHLNVFVIWYTYTMKNKKHMAKCKTILQNVKILKDTCLYVCHFEGVYLKWKQCFCKKAGLSYWPKRKKNLIWKCWYSRNTTYERNRILFDLGNRISSFCFKLFSEEWKGREGGGNGERQLGHQTCVFTMSLQQPTNCVQMYLKLDNTVLVT